MSDIKEKLERFLPIRMILRIDTGIIQGKVEHSFSMDWDDNRANVFWSGPAYSILGEHTLDGEEWANQNTKRYSFTEFVIDPLAEDSPIGVDWEAWLSAESKFDKRNAKIKPKPHGLYMLRAMAAERERDQLRKRVDTLSERLNETEDKLDKINEIINPDTDSE